MGLEEVLAYGLQSDVIGGIPIRRGIAGPICGDFEGGKRTDVAHMNIGADGFRNIETVLEKGLVLGA